MTTTDDLSIYLADRLEGTYDCTDRITVRGYYPMGQTSGGLLTWWNQIAKRGQATFFFDM